MAHEENTLVLSFVAGADMNGTDGGVTDGRNRFVTLGNGGTVTISAANAVAVGVMTSNPAAGQVGRVVVGNVVPIKVGVGGVVAGTPAGAGADGTAVTAATTKLGVPLETGAAGEIVSFKFVPTAVAGA